jgi:cation transport regulator ChaC
VAQARLASIRKQEALIAELAEINAWNLRTARLAGMGAVEDRRQSLVALATSRETDEAATQQRLAELDAQLAAVVKPLPSSSAKLATLQKALAELGVELSAAQRLTLTLEAVQTVRDEVKKNRDAAAAAQSKEDVATVPPSPAPKESAP